MLNQDNEKSKNIQVEQEKKILYKIIPGKEDALSAWEEKLMREKSPDSSESKTKDKKTMCEKHPDSEGTLMTLEDKPIGGQIQVKDHTDSVVSLQNTQNMVQFSQFKTSATTPISPFPQGVVKNAIAYFSQMPQGTLPFPKGTSPQQEFGLSLQKIPMQQQNLPCSLPQQNLNIPIQHQVSLCSVSNQNVDSNRMPISNAEIDLVVCIEGDRARYGCNVTIKGKTMYREIPVKDFATGKWLSKIPGFAVFQGSKSWNAISAYLNALVGNYSGPSVLEIENPGWFSHSGAEIYVTPAGVIGMPYSIISRKGQHFIVQPGHMNFGDLNEYLSKNMLTPTKPVVDVILLYNVLSFLHTVFSDAGCPVKFLIFLTGKRGSLKTSLALALTQIEQRKRPEYIMKSTSAGLEAGFSTYKDAVMLIDDLAPTIDSTEQRAMHQNLELLVRCFGDGTGKKRNLDFLSPDVKVNQYVAQGGAIITGEYISGVESSLARCLILSISEGDVDKALLKALQDDDSWLARFLFGFLTFVSSNYEKVKGRIRESMEIFKAETHPHYSNLRYAEYRVQLKVAVEILIDYGLANSLIDLAHAELIRNQFFASIETIVLENDKNLIDESPVAYLCRAILEAVEGEKYQLLQINTLEPKTGCILYDENFYYIPQPMLKKIKSDFDRDNGHYAGNPLMASKNLCKILADNGVIAIYQEGNTTRYAKKITGGGNGRFLCIFKEKLWQYAENV